MVLDHVVRGQESITESMPGDDASPPERLDAFLLAMGRCVEEQPDFVPIVMREQMDGARYIEPEVRERFFGFFGMVRKILEEGIARGAFRPLDPHATHLSLIGSLMFYKLTEPARATYRRAGAMPSPIPSWAEYVDHVRTLFAIGLQADGERAGD